MNRPDSYATPGATWAAIRAAAQNAAARTGVPVSDLVQLLLFDRLLARVFADPNAPFVLKGGTRMLAFIPQARATVDIDLEVADHSVDAAVERLSTLVRMDIGDRLRFTLSSRTSRFGSEDQPNVSMVTLTFQAAGIGQRVKVDLAVHDRAGSATVRGVPAFRVALGRAVPAPEYVMVTIEQQIADKVAAMMERRHGSGDGRSSRAKDLVDLALIAQHLPCDAALLHVALGAQIRERALHPFVAVDASPTIQVGYATVARKAKQLTLTWQEAEALTNRLVAPVLARAVRTGTWDPATGAWRPNA